MHGLVTLAKLNARAAKADAILKTHEAADKAKAKAERDQNTLVKRQD
jgi:hypothetical protein